MKEARIYANACLSGGSESGVRQRLRKNSRPIDGEFKLGRDIIRNTQRLKLFTGIFLFTCGLLLLSAGGHIYVKDGGAMYFMAESILDHQWFDVPINPNTVGGKTGPDGLYYTPFGILQPLLAIPFLLFGKLLIPWSMALYTPVMTIIFFNAVVTALLAGLLAVFFIDLGVTPKRAAWTGILIIFSTPFWIYSRTFFSEPLTSLGTLAAAWAIYRYGEFRKFKYVIFAGIITGGIILVRPVSGIAIPALFLYLVLVETRHRKDVDLKPIAVFSGLVILGIGFYLFYNHVRFGSILETGYDKLPSGQARNFTLNPLTGLKILLFSPGKSIFIFMPLVAGSLAGIFIWIRNRTTRPEALLALIMTGLFLLVLSQWARVEGGVTWGPRLIMPAIPVLLISLTPLLKNDRWIKTIYLLIILGILVQIPGILVNFSTYIYLNSSEYFHPLDGAYRFDFNPFPGHINLLIQYIRELPHLTVLDPETAIAHRQLIPINYHGQIDLWFVHLWQDGVSLSFIFSFILFQILLTVAGFLIIINYLRKPGDVRG